MTERGIETMRKPELTALGAKLGLGSRAALDVEPKHILRERIRAALAARDAK